MDTMKKFSGFQHFINISDLISTHACFDPGTMPVVFDVYLGTKTSFADVVTFYRWVDMTRNSSSWKMWIYAFVCLNISSPRDVVV